MGHSGRAVYISMILYLWVNRVIKVYMWGKGHTDLGKQFLHIILSCVSLDLQLCQGRDFWIQS